MNSSSRSGSYPKGGDNLTLQDKALDYGVGIGAVVLGLVAKLYGIDGEFFALVAAVAGIMFGLGIRKA